MGNNKKIGTVVLIVGILTLLLALLYDYMGGSPGIGPNQTVGIIAGVIITVVGAVLTFKKAKSA